MSDSEEHQSTGETPPAEASRPDVPPFADLVLRTPPNWPVIGFLALLGGLHLTVAALSLRDGRWACHVSIILGTIFVSVAAVGYRCRSEVALLTSQRRLRLRTGMGRFCYERSVPFSAVRAVRLMVEPGLTARQSESLIELLCRGEDIPCPPTTIPREQALFMAMAMDVPLIKVSEDSSAVGVVTAGASAVSIRPRFGGIQRSDS